MPLGCCLCEGLSDWPIFTAGTTPLPRFSLQGGALAWEVPGDVPSLTLALGRGPQVPQLSWPPHLSLSVMLAAALGFPATPSGLLFTFLCAVLT